MTSYSFTETADHEYGFSEVYDTEIAPFFRDLDADRDKTILRAKRLGTIIALVTLFATAIMSLFVHPVAGLFPLVFGGGLTAFVYTSRRVRNAGTLKEFLRPLLCKFIGDVTYHPVVPEEFLSIARLQDLGVVPRAHREVVDFALEGTRRDIGYRLISARFSNRNNGERPGQGSYYTLFSGVVLEIDCPVDMPLTVFSRDFGKNFNSLYEWAGGGNLPPQKLVLKDDELEEIFEIYTEDTDRAGTFLTDEFARNLLTLGKRYQSGTDFVAAAFEGRKFYMALNLSRDFMGLEFGNEPFSESNDILHTAMEDLLLPRVVVDSLTGDD